jgi:hypothetical protein
MELDKLLTLYSAVSNICQDYSRMTDGYSLATGDNKFEEIPEDIRRMIRERQEFFSYRSKIKSLLREKILQEMKNYE